jgi:hypothetical protein
VASVQGSQFPRHSFRIPRHSLLHTLNGSSWQLGAESCRCLQMMCAAGHRVCSRRQSGRTASAEVGETGPFHAARPASGS